MNLSSGAFHVSTTLLDEIEEVVNPLTGPEGTEEVKDNKHYHQHTMDGGRRWREAHHLL